jgi:hypothetical protein
MKHELYTEVSLAGRGVWVAVHGSGVAYPVETVLLAQYGRTYRVTMVLTGDGPKALSMLEPEATGQTLHATEEEARAAAAFAKPEDWLAIED